jgi:L-fuculose-phosphate aldolase
VAGLAGRNGVLLGNHGMIATGETLDQAMWRAGELETLARMYYLAIAVGKPAILSDDEIMRIVERFKGYGQTTPAPLVASRKKAETKRRAKKAGASKKSGAKKPARPRAKKARAAARKA